MTAGPPTFLMEIVAVTRISLYYRNAPKVTGITPEFLFLPCSLAAALFIPISGMFTMPVASGTFSH
jgi:hypothetical protein